MALSGPTWRIKSRPCPFYQQGRCLFADSCNFVHTASVNRPQSEHTLSPQQPQQGISPETNTLSPNSARSPPRSPRTAGLLLALKGVIADDPDDLPDDDTNKIPSPTPQTPSVLTESTNTVPMASNTKTTVTPTINEVEMNQDTQDLDTEDVVPFVQQKEARPRPVIRTIQSSPTEPGQENISPAKSGKSTDLLSPVDSVSLRLMTFNLSPRASPSFEDEVIDSGFAETFPSSSKYPPSAPSSPLKATFGVLNSPFASPSSRVLSPRLSAFIGNLPPDASQDEPSDISLDSPTNRYSCEIQGSEEYVVVDDSFEDSDSMRAQFHSSSTDDGHESYVVQPTEEEEESDEEAMLPEVLGVAYAEDVEVFQVEDEVQSSVTPRSPIMSPVQSSRSPIVSPVQSSVTPRSPGISPVQSSVTSRSPIISPVQSNVTSRSPIVSPVQSSVTPRSPGISPVQSSATPRSPGISPVQSSATPRSPIVSPVLSNVTPMSPIVSPVQSNIPSRSPIISPVQSYVTPRSPILSPKLEERLPSPRALSPPALAPVSMSRSSSQDTDGEALSFSDLFVSTEAMESQTTVDLDDVEGADSPLGLIYADYSDSPSEESRGLEPPCENLAPMPSPFSPETSTAALRRESSPVPEDFRVEGAYRAPSVSSSQTNSPVLAYDQEPGSTHEQVSLDHSVSVFSPPTPLEQVSPGIRPSPSMTFDTFFSREDDEDRPEENIVMRDFNEALSPFPSPPLSQAKTPSPVPPVQEQLRPIPAASESSMSMSGLSPPTALRPGSLLSAASLSVPTPDSLVPGVVNPTTSRKVPFGFRNSKRFSNIVPSRPVSILQPPLTSQSERMSSPEEAASPTNTNRTGLRPLRLSLLAGPRSAPSYNTTFPPAAIMSRNSIRSQRESLASLSSSHVSLHNRLLSFSLASAIPEPRNNPYVPSEEFASPLSSYSIARLKNFDDPRTAPISQSASWLHPVEEGSSPIEGPTNEEIPPPQEDIPVENPEQAPTEQVFPLPSPFPAAPLSAPAQPVHRPPMYAIGTPKPTLMFAIASDDVNQVRQVLESGEVNPNESIGPQSALEFALTNDQLANKMEIVKTLLSFGADPKALHPRRTPSPRSSASGSPAKVASPPKALMEAIDPATRYYVERADATSTRRTSALIHRSFFRPLTRVRYELIGQDRALEELFKVLSIHSRQLSTTPIVVLLCGPSGHGKSLLARKFGALLDVPTHTVNMTALDSTQDLWRSYSMSPYETPSMCTLAEFLINNEGKRCVVVLDEIEKTRDEKTLWSLLMPWELGRCTFEANGRPVDCRNVVWLGTSNVGHDLVLEHHQARPQPDSPVTREEYVDLMGLLRPRVSQRLGASILSRVTSVLPFVPFTTAEKRAICYEALHSTGGDIIRTLSKDVVSSMVDKALVDYITDEGARSLYRAVSNQLLDNL